MHAESDASNNSIGPGKCSFSASDDENKMSEPFAVTVEVPSPFVLADTE
jgi:hypothetical protein